MRKNYEAREKKQIDQINNQRQARFRRYQEQLSATRRGPRKRGI